MTRPGADTDPAPDDAGPTGHRPGWAERLVRQLDRFQQRYAVIGFPFAVFQKFGNDQAGAKATLMAYYGFFALFPLLLLFATILGFLLPGNPQLQASLINSALANFPVIGEQLRSEVHPLEGNTAALVIGIIGTLYGAFGIGLSAQNAMNSVWNIPFVKWPSFWYRYARTVAFIFLLGVPTVATTVLSTIATVVRGGASVTLGFIYDKLYSRTSNGHCVGLEAKLLETYWLTGWPASTFCRWEPLRAGRLPPRPWYFLIRRARPTCRSGASAAAISSPSIDSSLLSSRLI